MFCAACLSNSLLTLVSRCSHLGTTTGLAGDGQEELEFGGELVFGVESVREVDSSDTAVGVDLDSEY